MRYEDMEQWEESLPVAITVDIDGYSAKAYRPSSYAPFPGYRIRDVSHLTAESRVAAHAHRVAHEVTDLAERGSSLVEELTPSFIRYCKLVTRGLDV